jgi:hypothetical protein
MIDIPPDLTDVVAKDVVDNLNDNLAGLGRRYARDRNRYARERNRVITEYYSSWLPVRDVNVGPKSIAVDGHALTDIELEEYNNIDCAFPGIVPIAILVCWRMVLTDLFERPDVNSYRYRSGVQMWCRYVRRFGFLLSADYVRDMLFADDVLPKEEGWPSLCGFRAWLLGVTYNRGGNLVGYTHLTAQNLA